MKIRVLIAEDSQTMRDTLMVLLAEDPRIEVVGWAEDGIGAIEMARSLRPDVITMDVIMPRLDGVGAIAAIMAEIPARILVVSSVVDNRQVDLTFQAIAAGALEVIAKPQGKRPEELRQWAKRIAHAICLMAEVPVVTRRPASATPAAMPRVEALAIAASTGGPPALARLLGGLPAGLPAAILVAQHIAPGFTDGLVRWLRTLVSLPLVVAAEGQRCAPGRVYFPPDGHDLEVRPGRVLAVTATGAGFGPSGDRLLASIAAVYGRNGAGMVLTGMGQDGAEGLFALQKAGGATFAQDPVGCVVGGMPQAAIARGAVRDILGLDGLAQAIHRLTRA